jgi:hypothetical protein
MVPMDKGKTPLLPAFMDTRENSLGTLISNSNAVHTSTGAGLMDNLRNNAGAEALLRGVAHRTNNGAWLCMLFPCQYCCLFPLSLSARPV